MIELSFDLDQPKFGFGGDTLNTAVYLRRLAAQQHEIAFVSVVGTDPLSEKMLTFIDAAGISTQFIDRHSEKLPGLYAINTNAVGERSFHYWRDNSAARTLFTNGFSILNTFDVIYLSGITLAILPSEVRAELLKWLEKWEGTLVFDSNYRRHLWQSAASARRSTSRAWRRADIGLPSLDDELALFEDRSETAVLQRLKGYGLHHGALKRGARGPLSLTDLEFCESDYPVAEVVVDTTAAGDSFNGGYLAALYSGADQRKAMIAGHHLATEVISRTGAIVEHQTS